MDLKFNQKCFYKNRQREIQCTHIGEDDEKRETKIGTKKCFNGGSVAKNLPFNAGDSGLIPDRETEIPCAKPVHYD